MDLLLVAATAMEIEPFAGTLELVHEYNSRLKSYKFQKLSIDILITGVGMTQTAFYLGKYLLKDSLLVINAGIAGSFDKNIPTGTVVNIISDQFADMGAEDGDSFLSLNDIGLQEKQYPYTDNKLINTSVYPSNVIQHLPRVSGITVNKVHGNEISIAAVSERYAPQVESMEGAAFLYCALSEKVPCAQVRAISNYVERRNRNAWDIPLAIKNLNKKLSEIVEEMANV